jgi:hypothetical protein
LKEDIFEDSEEDEEDDEGEKSSGNFLSKMLFSKK